MPRATVLLLPLADADRAPPAFLAGPTPRIALSVSLVEPVVFFLHDAAQVARAGVGAGDASSTACCRRHRRQDAVLFALAVFVEAMGVAGLETGAAGRVFRQTVPVD